MIIRWGRKGLLVGAYATTFVTAVAITHIQEYQYRPSFKQEFWHITPAEVEEIVSGGVSGKRKYEILPRRIWIQPSKKSPILRLADITLEEAEAASPVKVIIDDEEYLVVTEKAPTPVEAIKMLPPAALEEKIKEVRAEFGITKEMAKDFLIKIAKQELEEGKALLIEMATTDEELALIIILSEV